ncbi:hypothetical protein QEL93_001580 [Pseudomonas putida]|nr:hypothetical protein [Pseudomonas putida]
MSGYSEEELMKWLKEDSRMFDWGLIAVMDRAKTNRLLSQEYIRHFEEGSYLPPQSGEVETDERVVNVIENAVLDVPRLSFENADLQDSRARLRMAMVGGNRVRLEKKIRYEVQRIDQYSPLQRPELEMGLQLARVPGDVEKGGEISLDLKDCTDFSFEFAGSSEEQKDMGRFFYDRFKALEEAQRRFYLGRIEQGSSELLRPDRFILRTQARDPNSQDPDGAVVCFIRMEGDQDGSMPTSHDRFRYLIPKDTDKEYSAAVSIDGRRVALTQLLRSLEAGLTDARFELKYEAVGSRNKLIGADLVEGTIDIEGTYERLKFDDLAEGLFADYYIENIQCALGGAVDARWNAKGDEIIVKGNLKGRVRYFFPGFWLAGDQYDEETKKLICGLINISIAGMQGFFLLPYEYDFEATYALEDTNNGMLSNTSFKLVPIAEPEIPPPFFTRPPANIFASQKSSLASAIGDWDWEKFWLGFALVLEELVSTIRAEISGRLTGSISLSSRIKDVLAKSFSLSNSIETLVDETIKLNFGNAIVGSTNRVPGDVVTFGKVNPSLTRFVIDDLEPVVAAGQKKQFGTLPAREGLTWRLEPATGCGDINPATGEYTAPDANSIDDVFIRGRVVARDAAGFESAALLTVVRSGLMLNPLVVMTWPSTKVNLQAGGLDSNGRFEWFFKNPIPHGSFETPDASTADMTYIAGPGNRKKAFHIDDIIVRHTETGEVCKSVIITKDEGPSLDIEIVVDIDSTAVTLKAFESGDDVTADTVWKVRRGPGKVNGDRYEPDLTSSEPFVLITGTFEDSRRPYHGFVIIPLPLSQNTRALAALCQEAC